MSTITLVFDKVQNHPIDPSQVQLGTESIFSTRISNGDFLTDLSIGPKTVNFTLEGAPEALVKALESHVNSYVTAVVQGNQPTPNVQIDGINYFITSVNPGAGFLLNGRRLYQSVQVTAKSNEITVAQ